MNPTARLLPLIALVLLTRSPLSAAADAGFAEVTRADDARVAATLAADPAGLGRLISDELVYTHGSGHVDDKASYTRAIVTGKPKYLSFTYESRMFSKAAPEIDLMRGRCHIVTGGKGKQTDNYLAYLAVWRNEDGAWRLLAWQSCHVKAKER